MNVLQSPHCSAGIAYALTEYCFNQPCYNSMIICSDWQHEDAAAVDSSDSGKSTTIHWR